MNTEDVKATINMTAKAIGLFTNSLIRFYALVVDAYGPAEGRALVVAQLEPLRSAMREFQKAMVMMETGEQAEGDN